MNTFRLTDEHRAFASAIAAGEDKYKAYLQHIAGPNVKKQTAKVKASQLLKNPKIASLVEQAIEARNKALVKANLDSIPKELTTAALNIEHLDSFHYSVIRGEVETEEIHPVVTITKDEKGKEISRTVAFHKVKRRPNIRERQASIDAIYKRFGSYAPSKIFGAFKNADPDEVDQQGERYLVLSNGDKVKLP